jgi:hypothetical protein
MVNVYTPDERFDEQPLGLLVFSLDPEDREEIVGS